MYWRPIPACADFDSCRGFPMAPISNSVGKTARRRARDKRHNRPNASAPHILKPKPSNSSQAYQPAQRKPIACSNPSHTQLPKFAQNRGVMSNPGLAGSWGVAVMSARNYRVCFKGSWRPGSRAHRTTTAELAGTEVAFAGPTAVLARSSPASVGAFELREN